MKKIVGFVLLILAVITFFLYLIFPFLSLLDPTKIILITLLFYVLNKIFLYTSLFILGKEFIAYFGKYLPGKLEYLLLKLLRVKPAAVAQISDK